MEQMNAERIGVTWATDAIREALSKTTPEECRMYLDSLRVMGMQLLANEIFNSSLGVGDLSNKNLPGKLRWDNKKYTKALNNVIASITVRVERQIKAQRDGELRLVTSQNKGEL